MNLEDEIDGLLLKGLLFGAIVISLGVAVERVRDGDLSIAHGLGYAGVLAVAGTIAYWRGRQFRRRLEYPGPDPDD